MPVKWFGDKLQKKLVAAGKRALDKTALLIANEAKRSMTYPKTGAAGSKRTASAPGEPPAVQMGRLRASVGHDAPRKDLRRIGTNVKYGRYLEIGTANISPRPFLRPAFIKEAPKLIRFLKNTI